MVFGTVADRLCLVASNVHKLVVLQNKWTMTCIYLSRSTNYHSWKATFYIYGYIYLKIILCPVLLQLWFLLFIENAFHSDVEGCYVQGYWFLTMQVGVVRKALLFHEGFSVTYSLLTNSANPCFFPTWAEQVFGLFSSSKSSFLSSLGLNLNCDKI